MVTSWPSVLPNFRLSLSFSPVSLVTSVVLHLLRMQRLSSSLSLFLSPPPQYLNFELSLFFQILKNRELRTGDGYPPYTLNERDKLILSKLHPSFGYHFSFVVVV